MLTKTIAEKNFTVAASSGKKYEATKRVDVLQMSGQRYETVLGYWLSNGVEVEPTGEGVFEAGGRKYFIVS